MANANDKVVRATPIGPHGPAVKAWLESVANNPRVRELLGRRHRLLQVHHREGTKKQPLQEPQLAAIFYNYSDNCAVTVTAPLESPERAGVVCSGRQPIPSPEEFDEALQIVKSDHELGPLLAAGRLEFYRPMPAILDIRKRDEDLERMIAVGLRANDTSLHCEIVGVNLVKGLVVRLPGRTPPRAYP
jgi:hypothetical protein